jgi:uncharacterized protein (UPF0305 family)
MYLHVFGSRTTIARWIWLVDTSIPLHVYKILKVQSYTFKGCRFFPSKEIDRPNILHYVYYITYIYKGNSLVNQSNMKCGCMIVDKFVATAGSICELSYFLCITHMI